MVDYSFGDQSGVLGSVPNAFMKKANLSNREFESLVEDNMDNGMESMTLFIDNIRLYRRPINYSDWMHLKSISIQDYKWLDQFENEDLLQLCENFPSMKFVIFTAFEDTPLDDYIWDRIPENVISINSANGVVFGGKVHPFPHGIERIMYPGYNHHEILKEYINSDIQPTKQLLVCHRDDTGARESLKAMFKARSWSTVSSKLDYEPYLQAIKNHKFVLCPSGNGIESARNWETLYMRRVPVFEDHKYKRELFKEFPVLFVDSYSQVTEELLKENDHLFQEAQKMEMRKLSLDYWFNKAL